MKTINSIGSKFYGLRRKIQKSDTKPTTTNGYKQAKDYLASLFFTFFGISYDAEVFEAIYCEVDFFRWITLLPNTPHYCGEIGTLVKNRFQY